MHSSCVIGRVDDPTKDSICVKERGIEIGIEIGIGRDR